MHEIEIWAPGSAACALCVINISSHETGRPAGRGGGGPGPMGPPLDPPLLYTLVCYIMFVVFQVTNGLPQPKTVI